MLTEREQKVVGLVAQGLSNTEIALALETSPQTVQKHLQRIFKKLDVRNRTQAALRGRAERLAPTFERPLW